jgi:putative flippase GtrA
MSLSFLTRDTGTGQRSWLGKMVRFMGSSAVATVCSEVTFLLLYGLLDTGTTLASVFGWLAGMVPNYWLARTWAWQLRGRPSVLREIVPYLAIVLTTLALATVVTGRVHNLVSDAGLSDTTRMVLVAGSFLSVYVVMFLVKFLLLDKLFGRLRKAKSERQAAMRAGFPAEGQEYAA